MRRLSYPLSTIILIETTFSSVEGVTTPTLKNAPPILSSLSPSFMSVYHHYTHIVNTFSSVEGATTPTLKNAPSILSPLCSSLWPFDVFFGPLPGGQVHLILDLPPSAWALVPRHGQKGFIDHPGGGSSLRLVDTSGAPWVLPFPAPCSVCSFDSFCFFR